MSDPHGPDIDGIGSLLPQTLGGGQKVFRDGPTPAFYVDGDRLAVVVGLHPGLMSLS